jgi:glycogen operon protein
MQQGTMIGTATPGRPWPLGVTFEGRGEGANIAVFSEHAERIELCLFDPEGRRETARLVLPERTDHVLHGFVPGLRPGQVYGFRAYGPWDPAAGHRFNPNRLLLDPYARALTGAFRWAGPNLVDPNDPFAFDPRDSAPFVPKGVMRAAPPEAAAGPVVPWERTVIYELHVRGMTRLHPAVPMARRGTYLGLAHPAVLEHLVELGVTTVELMPVMAFLDERRLAQKGLVNYWGYNSLAFLAPERRYAVHDPLAEFRAMVAGLHSAGLEVVQDVVYNHTAETDELGPTLSFRGLDNAAYYRLQPGDRRLYVNDTGCGNSLNTAHPRVLQLVMDSLRYWAAQGVDGFRFDLAPVLGRNRAGAFDADAPLLQAIRQDPELGRRKLVAEPWDVGPEGYRLGGFPPPFAEWNDRFRDCARRFWRGDEAVAPELASRLLGSAELFEAGGRKSFASVNYIAAHDGFTLLDAVSYTRRHNEANGEDNRDGHHENFSLNHGVEGPSADPAIGARRRRHVRNLLATLFLAQGTPMLAMGDEALRSQKGNNNAYCQDNETSWYPWGEAGEDGAHLTAFVARLAKLRRRYGALFDGPFRHGRRRDSWGVPDVLWLAPDGRPMTPAAWEAPETRSFALLLNGRSGGRSGGRSDAPAAGDLLAILISAAPGETGFLLPALPWVERWLAWLDTTAEQTVTDEAVAGSVVSFQGPALRVYAAWPAGHSPSDRHRNPDPALRP